MNTLKVFVFNAVLLLSGFVRAQDVQQVYLLPESYRGKAVIIYNRPFGDSVKVSNDSIYFSVPSDGIAVVKSSIKSRLDQSLFYQMDANGKAKQLPILTHDLITSSADSVKLRNEIGVFIFGTIGNCDPKEPESFCYTDFYVGSLNDMPKYYTPQKAQDFGLRMEQKAKWRH